MPVTDVLGEGGLQPGGSATVEVAHGGGQVNSDVVVEWDLDNDGDFSEADEDITPYVLAAETLTGRDWPSQLTGKASAGKFKATLDNSTDRFSKRNLASPLNADPFSLKLGRKLRVRARIDRALSVVGVTNSFATTPHVAALGITGDLVMGCEFDPAFLDGGGAQTLVSKWDETSDERSAMLQIDSSGVPRVFTSPDGTAGSQRWIDCAIRATSFWRQCWWAAVDVDNGAGGMTVRFYWARRHTDTPILIDTQVSAGTTSIFNSTAPLKVAARGDGTGEPLGGDVYWAEWRAGDINSTDYRAAVNFAAQPAGTTSFDDDEGLTWTVGAGASIIEDPNVDDPILLARDRFNRSAGSTVELGAAETGQVWEHGLAGTGPYRFIIFNNEARIAFPDVGFNVPDLVDLAPHRDCYVQARLGQPVDDGTCGVIARYVDPNNYLRVEFALNQITVIARVAGVDTGPGAYYEVDWPSEGFIVGLHVEQSTGRLYINGVTGASSLSYDLEPFTIPAALHAGTKAGIYGYWPNGDLEAPTVDDFYVWDRPTTELPGVLWTGDLIDLRPTVDASGAKIAQLEGDGLLARAALPDVRAPVLPKEGEFTGVLTGEVLHKAQLLHPPGLLDLGTVRTGPISMPDGKAMTMLREFEDTELGLLYETPEGPLGYQDRSARIGATAQAEFSDATGAQFSYSTLDLLDSRQEIINRVQAGVAAEAPSGGGGGGAGVALTVRTNNAGAGVASHVDVLLPPVVSAGDLLVVFIASTVAVSGRGWKTPIFWQVHRQFGTDDDDSIRTRVFSHFCDGTEASTTVRFYQDTTTGGAWIAHIWRIENWYESYENGVAMADFTSGDNPTPFDHGWGRDPTAFFVARAGLTSVGGGSVNTSAVLQNFPEGWNANGTVSQLNGTVNGFDVALATSYRFDAQDRIDPGPFKGFQGFAINECVIFAVRGYNGPHTKATLDNPQTTGGEGRVVTVEDQASQVDHNIVRSAPTVPALFRSEAEAEAYCEAVLAIYADDRPLPRIGYFANRSGAYRAQAYRRRVGDAIRFIADGRTGMGIDSDHFIEAVGHRFTHGTKLWEVTYDLSPG